MDKSNDKQEVSMPYSGLTKKAYASALQELMQEMPFEKITVSQICEKHGMSRKNFYYHFRDKYDLVAWIFDENYAAIIKKQPTSAWELMELLCDYLYENRDFYRKVLMMEGQNSFSSHFEEVLTPIIQDRLQAIWEEGEMHPICISFLSDGLIGSVRRWLLKKDCMPAREFISILRTLIENITTVQAS